jgi:hypothetical protein
VDGARPTQERPIQHDVIKRRATAKQPERGDVEFADGVCASLRWLSQSLTYSGLLDGAPTAEMNRDLVESARERYRHSGPRQDPHDPLVIEPRQVQLPMREHDPFGQRSLLPRAFCAAEYWSPTPVPAEKTWSESYLVLVWWQDDSGRSPSRPAYSKRSAATPGRTWPTAGLTECVLSACGSKAVGRLFGEVLILAYFSSQEQSRQVLPPPGKSSGRLRR